MRLWSGVVLRSFDDNDFPFDPVGTRFQVIRSSLSLPFIRRICLTWNTHIQREREREGSLRQCFWTRCARISTLFLCVCCVVEVDVWQSCGTALRCQFCLPTFWFVSSGVGSSTQTSGVLVSLLQLISYRISRFFSAFTILYLPLCACVCVWLNFFTFRVGLFLESFFFSLSLPSRIDCHFFFFF